MITCEKTPPPNKVTILQSYSHIRVPMNLWGCIQPVRAPPNCFSTSSGVSGLITNCTSWPCEEGRRGPLLTSLPTPALPEWVCAGVRGRTGVENPLRCGSREEPACPVHCTLPPSPTIWAPSASTVLSASSSCTPQVSLRGHSGPHGVTALPLVAQPSTIDTASARGPLAGPCPAWLRCPC